MLWEAQTRDTPTKIKKPTVWKSRATRYRQPTSRQPRRPYDTRSRCTRQGEPLGPPPRHPTAIPCPTDHQHHLSCPPSRCTTAQARAATPHDPATCSPSCTEKIACRPRPSHQYPGPPPRPKSQIASSKTESAEPIASPPWRHKTITQPCKQLLRPMKHMSAMDPEAAASTHIHHPGPLPRLPLSTPWSDDHLHSPESTGFSRRSPPTTAREEVAEDVWLPGRDLSATYVAQGRSDAGAWSVPVQCGT
jgi:hypothetical protein